jgi:hypothetical protein
MTMRIKPRQVKDSLLVYCAQTEEGQGDFSSISIKDKRIEFRFDSGSGKISIHVYMYFFK